MKQKQSNKTIIGNTFLCSFCFVLLVFSCRNADQINDPPDESADPSYSYSIPFQADDGWETASLESVGLRLEPFLDMMNQFLNQEDHFYHGILVCKSNQLVFEEYFSGYDRHNDSSIENGITYFARDTLHFLASVSKSVTSVLMGIAIDEGDIDNVDMKIYSWFPELNQYFNEEKRNISIANCLYMSSGFPWDESTYGYDDSRNDLVRFLSSTTPFADFFSHELISEPGELFLYSSFDNNVVGEIVHRSIGPPLYQFAELNLFTPLGISEYRWRTLYYKPDVTYASGGLYLKPRDMAKIGQLYLNKGSWKGVRVVSEDWIDDSIQESIALPTEMQGPFHSYGYGYQWWLENFDSGTVFAFSARGHGNQYIIIIPECEIVIVLTGGAYHISPLDSPITWYDLVDGYILPALE